MFVLGVIFKIVSTITTNRMHFNEKSYKLFPFSEAKAVFIQFVKQVTAARQTMYTLGRINAGVATKQVGRKASDGE